MPLWQVTSETQRKTEILWADWQFSNEKLVYSQNISLTILTIVFCESLQHACINHVSNANIFSRRSIFNSSLGFINTEKNIWFDK